MSKSISPIQTIEELEYLRYSGAETLFLPLDLETHAYCIINKIKHINPIEVLDDEFHKNAVLSSQDYLNQLSFDLGNASITNEFIAFIRFTFHQIYYLDCIVKKVFENFDYDSIIVSGWELSKATLYSTKNYVVSKFSNKLFDDKVKYVNYRSNIEYIPSKVYSLDKIKYGEILINSPGYNFKRLIDCCSKLNAKVFFIGFGENNVLCSLKNFIRKSLQINCSIYSSDNKCEINTIIKTDNYKYDEIINDIVVEKINYFSNQLHKCQVIDQILDSTNPHLVASWAIRGVHGYLLEKSHKMGIKSIAISHGTIAESFNQYDDIYKKTIAEAVFSGESTYTAIQSKITKNALRTHNVKGEPLQTGNLIFAESVSKEREIVLYAVTLKDFFGMQFLGVELYYEFLENLNIMDQFNKLTNNTVVVKLHPSAIKSVDKLRKLYPNLNFALQNIENLLKRAKVTISFSSTVIEDSLYSQVPVILFDQWSRYQHCQAETNPKIKNKAIYYTTHFDDLIQATTTIEESTDIDFEEYIYPGTYQENFKKTISDLIK